MANWLFYIIALVFYACCGFLELMAKWLGLTYTEACVYFNLYLQYGVLMLSALSIVFVATRMLFLEVTRRRWVVLVLSVLYNVPFVWLGAFLYNRYGGMNCDAAFTLCRSSGRIPADWDASTTKGTPLRLQISAIRSTG